MPIHEVEKGSLSVCSIPTTTENAIIKPNENDSNHWTELPSSTDTSNLNSNAVIHSIVPFSSLPDGTTVRIPPMEWNCGGWDDEHFHPNFRLPLTSSASSRNKGMVVTLEAMARECVAVALSPQPSFQLGKTYVIHIGASSNFQTVIRRRLPNGTEAVDVMVSSPHICSDDKFVKYWILLQNNGQISVGIGASPGKHCIAQMDDSLYHALRSGVDAVKFVGLGNSALGRKARDVKVRNVKVMPIPDSFQAFGGIPLSHEPFSMEMEEDNDTTIKDQELWQEYEKECAKAQLRAVKFGVEYKQPPPNAFFKWSEARRMRANPEKGFITGIDIMSKEEKEKAKKRKQRFEEEDRKNKAVIGGDDDVMDGDGIDDHEKMHTRKKREPLALEQAWDNEGLVGDMRVDVPESLYLKDSSQDDDAHAVVNSEATMDDDSAVDKVVLVPTKIHLFAIDWAAFKQIRTDDIISSFKDYGPSYVEWLGELSCNIHFEDKYSAGRALQALSRALPTDIPLNSEKVKEMIADVDHDKDVAGGADNDNQDTGMLENAIDTQEDLMEESKPISATNLGRMGWRMCNDPIRKVQSDKYGKRGTRSRCIARIATSLDTLAERPTTWPEPPPGFTTNRVLGPGSDFKTWTDSNDRRRGGGGKRRKHSRRESFDDRNSEERYGNSDERYETNDRDRYDDGDMDADSTDEFGRSAIDTGLKASR
jgi:hypothetical protein